MKNSRIARINDEILRECAEIIRRELKDPRVGVMTSVTKVNTSSDLSVCKIYVSVLGDEKQQAGVMEGLQSAAGFIRKQIAERVNLRVTPQLTFVLDDSLAYSMKIERMLKEIGESARTETDGEGEDA